MSVLAAIRPGLSLVAPLQIASGVTPAVLGKQRQCDHPVRRSRGRERVRLGAPAMGEGQHAGDDGITRGSVGAAILLIAGTTVGGGFLALPSVVAPTGFLPSAIVLTGTLRVLHALCVPGRQCPRYQHACVGIPSRACLDRRVAVFRGAVDGGGGGAVRRSQNKRAGRRRDDGGC